MPNIGPLEIVIVLIIALIVFGPKRLPEMGARWAEECASSRTRSPDKDEDERRREIERTRARRRESGRSRARSCTTAEP